MTFRLHQIDGDFITDAELFRVGAGVLGSGSVTTPLACIDLALPEEFRAFRLELTAFAGLDSIIVAPSADRGTTWMVEDQTAPNPSWDQWAVLHQMNIIGGNADQTGNAPFVYKPAYDSCPYPLGSGALQVFATMQIFPGSTTDSPVMFGNTGLHSADGGFLYLGAQQFVTALNPNSTKPIAPARANLLRLMPYGNGDPAGLSSGDTFAAGSWELWGIK